MSTLLRIAIPKGRLQPECMQLFRDAGCEVPRDVARELRVESGGIEWIFVRGADAPVYVAHGAADAAVAGLDQILESDCDVEQAVELPFARCRMMLIGGPASPPLAATRSLTIATKYPRITRMTLGERTPLAEIVPLHGSVELALVLRLADYIVDLVETGETIRANNLTAIETLLEVSPRLIVNRHACRFKPALRDLVERLRGIAPIAVDAKAGER